MHQSTKTRIIIKIIITDLISLSVPGQRERGDQSSAEVLVLQNETERRQVGDHGNLQIYFVSSNLANFQCARSLVMHPDVSRILLPALYPT